MARLTIPKGFGPRESRPRSMRWPKAVVERVAAVAKSRRQRFNATTFYLLLAALEEFERAR